MHSPKIVYALFLFCSSLTLHAQKGLSKATAQKRAIEHYDVVMNRLKQAAATAVENKVITYGSYRMPLGIRILGKKPADGRSLYISLHGGGNTAPDVNDKQWQNQIGLYTPEEGVYVAPRAPTNTWNLWHENHIDNMFDSLIRYFILTEEVNPDKVYLMGYSAGGDGTFQLAPRMADRWAAASMMAGHPGDASIQNLRNLPFAIYMGGKDAAYNRNTLAAEWGQKLDSLEQLNPGNYIHDVHIYPELPHWMNRNDTIAVYWMAGFRRNPNPTKVEWIQDDRLQHRFYWLQIPDTKNTATGEKAVVAIHNNTITIEENSFTTLYINLNDELLNLDKKVIVKQGKKILLNAVLKRNETVIQQTAATYQDKRFLYSARLVVKDGAVSIFH